MLSGYATTVPCAGESRIQAAGGRTKDPSQSSTPEPTSQTEWPGPGEAVAPGPILTLLSLSSQALQSSGRGGCRRIILTDTRPPGVAEVARAECVLCHFLAPGSVSCADYWESDSVPAALLQKPPWERASQQNPHPNP